jgi:hypothetical protein
MHDFEEKKCPWTGTYALEDKSFAAYTSSQQLVKEL